MASKRSSGRSNGFFALFAAVLVAASATACCRSSSSTSGSSSGAGIGSPSAFNVGDSVDVEWNGGWWQARILSVNGGLYRIHYVGWGNNWDESVPARRVRTSTGTAKRGSGPNLANAAGPRAPGLPPPGSLVKARCRGRRSTR